MKNQVPHPFMSWLNKFTGNSQSAFVREEVLKNLPRSIVIKFLSEFDDKGDPVIFICSPEHTGLISEARTNEEAIEKAQDAILTFFDVPRECAKLIEFDIEEVSQTSMATGDSASVIIQQFKVRELSHA
jgi:predicted RNase H-like HicB family nuclease